MARVLPTHTSELLTGIEYVTGTRGSFRYTVEVGVSRNIPLAAHGIHVHAPQGGARWGLPTWLDLGDVMVIGEVCDPCGT